MILVAGNARSGTSWLGKIFDSHPTVAYRHEPDSSVPCYDFPFVVEPEDYAKYGSVASTYLRQLCKVRTIRAVGRRPRFPKSYRFAAAEYVDSLVIGGMQVLARVTLISALLNRVNVPMLPAKNGEAHCVIKSVISMGRVGLYARAIEGQVVFVLRHPCAVVASQLRGIKLGKLKHQTPFQTIAKCEVGREYGLTVDALESMRIEEQIAWTWLVMNEHALRGLSDSENAIVVTHETLCEDPIREAKRLFDFCGLGWPDQTAAFLIQSARSTNSPSYFDLDRNPKLELRKWEKELPEKTVENVEAILGASRILSRFW